VNNAGSDISTTNENNVSVAVGYARPQSNLVSWLLIIEQSHSEAWAPITKLRHIVFACVFGTMAAIIVVVFPLAHFSVRPIRRLRDATEKSIAPPGFSPARGSIGSGGHEYSGDDLGEIENSATRSLQSKNSFLVRLRNLTANRRKSPGERSEDERRRVFKIPGKVQDRKHCITDELTELTRTFNDMSDELMLQYSSLVSDILNRMTFGCHFSGS
jgi:osomolarity two-component system sensor histidine kinase SLN1